MSHHVYPDTISRDSDWRDLAVCRDHGRYDPELWFPNGNTGPALLQIEEAKAVCRHCPAVEWCLQWALETGQDSGVWGGLSEDERRVLRRRTARRTAPTEQPVDDESYADLFHKHTQPASDGHLIWNGPTTSAVRAQGKRVSYLRLAFEVGTGQPPYGRVKVDCDRYRCVAPAHLSDEPLRAARKASA